MCLSRCSQLPCKGVHCHIWVTRYINFSDCGKDVQEIELEQKGPLMCMRWA